MQDRRLPSKIFLLSGLFGIAFSAIVLLLMHFVNVEFDPASRYISEYALGKFGTLAAVSFTIYGISVVMLFLWLNKFFSKKLKSGIGLKLILLFGITIIILGFLNTDPKTGQATLNGIIHSLSGGIGILSFYRRHAWDGPKRCCTSSLIRLYLLEIFITHPKFIYH